MAIQDFGKKIGGARKDLWAGRGLRIEDIEDFNLAERAKYITKNNIWPKPDYEKMMNEEGYSRDALYFIKTVRDSIPTSPILSHMDSEEEIMLKQEVYIDFLTDFKEELLKVKTPIDIADIDIEYLVDHDYVYKDYHSYKMTKRGEVFVNNKFFKALQMSRTQAEREATRKGFLGDNLSVIKEQFEIKQIDYNFSINKSYSENGKICIQHDRYSGKNFYYTDNQEFIDLVNKYGINQLNGNYLIVRRGDIIGITHDYQEAQEFVTKQAQTIFDKNEQQKAAAKEAGKADPDRKKGLTPPILAHINRTGPEMRAGNVVGEDFLKDFNIKGGEFGNWLNEAERQTNMNMAYDSFKDMAKALGINDADIAMGNRLNIAFGSRGRKGAAAHYEPMREVINLTKMKGAGSLAHELFHAMDDIAGKEMGFGGFATAKEYEKNAFAALVKAMKYKEVTLSVDELNKELEERGNKQADKLRQDIVRMVPDRVLTPELIEQRDKLIDDLMNNTKNPDYIFRETEFGRTGKIKFVINEESIKDISAFIDTHSKSYKMTQNNKQWLASQLNNIQTIYAADRATEPVTRRVETEFYKNSKKMDDSWAKTTNGYWHSNIEMAARAFACYLYDKMAEMGIRNDYLTGHAFQVGLNANGETIPVYPKDDERAIINQAFDKVIEEMKTLGIFHEREETVIAAETLDYYIVAEKTPTAVQFTVYDNRDFSEVSSGKLSPEVNLHNAIDTVRGLMKQDVAEEMDYSVFEATKASKLEELNKAAQQKALQDSMSDIDIDPASCKQLTFEDVIAMAKEEKANSNQKATLQEKQFEIIQQTNPMRDDIHVGIRSVEDIKTFEEAFNEAMKDEESFQYGDFDEFDAAAALRTGKITIYSSKPIEQGGFVSTSYNMAKDYAGSGRVYSQTVSLNEVAWINGDEGQYAKVPERERETKREETRAANRSHRNDKDER